jgi:hypothetical protein
MASERSMRSRITRALKHLDAMAVENAVQPGTPDVEFIGGWIELKSVDSKPKREDTVVRVDHFTPLQRLWLKKRRERGGRAWLLLRVGREWLLIDGKVAAAKVGSSTMADLIRLAVCHWPSTPSDESLRAAFTCLCVGLPPCLPARK